MTSYYQSVNLVAVPGADGFDRYVVTVVPPRAPPGRLTLRLTFTDGATGQTARSETEIALRK